MKREQLTNVETEAQCQALAELARQGCVTLDNIAPHTAGAGRCVRIRGWLYTAQYYERNVIALADRIIALRSQQVTP